MPKTSIVVQCAALAVVAIVAAMPAGANAPAKPIAKPQAAVVKTATPAPRPSVNPFPTCGPPVNTPNIMDRLNAMNPFVVHCPV